MKHAAPSGAKDLGSGASSSTQSSTVGSTESAGQSDTQRLEKAQAALRDLGFPQCEPQAHGWAVNLRLPALLPAAEKLQQMQRLLQAKEALTQAMTKAGFSAISLALG